MIHEPMSKMEGVPPFLGLSLGLVGVPLEGALIAARAFKSPAGTTCGSMGACRIADILWGLSGVLSPLRTGVPGSLVMRDGLNTDPSTFTWSVPKSSCSFSRQAFTSPSSSAGRSTR